MLSARYVPFPSHQSTGLRRWIYYLALGFLFGAAALRAFLIFHDEQPSVSLIMLVLIGWLALFMGDNFLGWRFPGSTAIFITAEAGLIMLLLLTTEQDFFACLFAILGMQAMQRYSRGGSDHICLSTPDLWRVIGTDRIASLGANTGVFDAWSFHDGIHLVNAPGKSSPGTGAEVDGGVAGCQ